MASGKGTAASHFTGEEICSWPRSSTPHCGNRLFYGRPQIRTRHGGYSLNGIAFRLETGGKRSAEVVHLLRSNKDQVKLWAIASSALHAQQANLGLSLLMQSTNEMIDVSLEQYQALTGHVPTAVIVLTLVLVILGTLSLGLRFAIDESRPSVLSAIYVIAYVRVINMMVDYDRPNTGFVRVSSAPLKLQLQLMQRSP